MENFDFYENMQTKERVYKEEAEEYVLDKLGIKVIPKGKNGERTTEQITFIDETVEWYFSGNWIKDEECIEEECNIFQLINEECELENGRD